MPESTHKNIIIVPLDGSELSEKAIAVAISLLRNKRNSSLVLLRMLEASSYSGWLPTETVEVERRERANIQSFLEEKRGQAQKIIESSAEKVSIDVEIKISTESNVADAVLKECLAVDASLIVMTSHGRGGWLRGLMGSNAERVLRICPVPVLIVKPEDSRTYDHNFKFHSILVPLDGTKRAEGAIPHVLDLAPNGKAQITLLGVSVVFKGYAFENDLRDTIIPDMNRIRAYLEGQAEWVRNLGYEVIVQVRKGNPAKEIIAQATESNVDLTVLVSKKREGLGPWLFGRVSEQLIRHGPQSFLALKTLEAEAGELR